MGSGWMLGGGRVLVGPKCLEQLGTSSVRVSFSGLFVIWGSMHNSWGAGRWRFLGGACPPDDWGLFFEGVSIIQASRSRVWWRFA